MMDCGTCRGRKHVYRKATNNWVRCGCVSGDRSRAAAAKEGAAEAPPLSDFGTNYGKFIRRALAGEKAFLAMGDPSTIEGAALSAVGAAEATGRASKLLRLGDVVDANFDRTKKDKMLSGSMNADLLVMCCGNETPHKFNGPLLAHMVARRTAAHKPTLIVAVGDPRALYGEAAEGATPDGTPSYRIGS